MCARGEFFPRALRRRAEQAPPLRAKFLKAGKPAPLRPNVLKGRVGCGWRVFFLGRYTGGRSKPRPYDLKF